MSGRSLLALLALAGVGLAGTARAEEPVLPEAIATASSPVATVSIPTASESLEALMAPVELPRPRSLTILHANDLGGRLDPLSKDPLHLNRPGEVGGLLRAGAWLDAERARGGAVLVLSAGNMLGPDMRAASTQGRSVVAAMNRLGFDAWLPSLYDFGYGLEALQERSREASAAVVLSNVSWTEGAAFARPYAVFERGGLRIAVLGLVQPGIRDYLDRVDRARITVEPPLAAVQRLVPLIRREASPDLVVALTHLSLDEEMPLLSKESGLDLVIGGFVSTDTTTTAVHEVVGLDGKRALHAGTFGTALGKVRLTCEPTPGGSYRVGRIEPDVVRLDDEHAPRHTWPEDLKALLDTFRADEARDWHRTHGDLAWLASGLDAAQTRTLVAEIMRARAGAEVGVVPRSFFRPEAFYGPVASAKSLYYAMPWEDALAVTQVRGEALAALYKKAQGSASPVAYLAGLSMREGQVLVNGRELDPGDRYLVATTAPAAAAQIAGLEALAGTEVRSLPVSVRRAVLQHFREAARTGRTVGPASFPDYYLKPFWKSSVQFTTDLTSRAVDTAGKRYPDLAWRTDKSGMSWGGDLVYQFGTAWGAHQLDDTFNLSYHSDQLAEGKSQTSSDKIQFIADYRADIQSSLARPFATLTLTTRFLNDPPPPFFLAQVGAGVSHQLGPLELREGVEYRHHLFDLTQKDRTGGTLAAGYKGSLGGFQLSSSVKLFATPQLDVDGLLIDSESKVALPLSDSTALTYQVYAYRNTLYPEWAMRHLVGLTLKAQQPWIF